MDFWAQNVLQMSTRASEDVQGLFGRIQQAAQELGFEYCAYGMQMPLPLTRPKTILLNNYPASWQKRYREAGFLAIDPSVAQGRRSRAPIVWNEPLFASAPQLLEEAKSAGLKVGWAQSSLDGNGVIGMLTLARTAEPLQSSELQAKQDRMQWLVQISHQMIGSRYIHQLQISDAPQLTPREIEILKWYADGKTASDIGNILNISVDTVKFHTKNCVAKLGAPNKTAAVVRALMMGLLV